MVEIKPFVVSQPHSLVVVSNRGPVTLEETERGIEVKISSGGLVSAVEPIIREVGGIWVAWSGRAETGEKPGDAELIPLPAEHPRYYFSELKLNQEEIIGFYQGFTNACLWPLCHSLIEKTVFDERQWRTYVQVNQKFAAAALKVAGPRQPVWVHDYHLALLPLMLKKRSCNARVSLFWHIPFPAADLFQALPWAREILSGMLGSELVAFHTRQYALNFLGSVERILGGDVDYQKGAVFWEGREVKVRSAPIGIDWRDFEARARNERVRRRALEIRDLAGGEWLLLGVDRLDYTKGILERLRALEILWERYPEWRRRLTLIQVAVPSRIEVPGYQQLRREVEEAIGRINGRFTEDYRVPIKYVFRSVSRDELVAHYLAADLAMVTPLRDGLNLVAKEYVISKVDAEGILLLSQLAGSAEQLGEALMVNPYNPGEVAQRIIQGIAMPGDEKRRRLAAMQKGIREQDGQWWWEQISNEWLGSYKKRMVIAPPSCDSGQLEKYLRGLNLG